MVFLRRIGVIVAWVMVLLAAMPVSPAAAQTVPMVGFYNNDSPYISYSSGWTRIFPRGGIAYSGDVHYTTTSGSWATFSFRGSTITLWYSILQSGGKYSVYIDGIYYEDINTVKLSPGSPIYRASRTWRVGNPGTTHQITLYAFYADGDGPPNTPINHVDGFSVDIPVNQLGTYDNTNVQYAGTWLYSNAVTGATNNTIHYSNTCGGVAHFTYSGDAIFFQHSRGPTYGIATVFLDGVYRGTIDMYSPTYTRGILEQYAASDVMFPLYNVPLKSTIEGLRLDTHTLSIVNSCLKSASSSDYNLDVDGVYSQSDTIAIEYVPQLQSQWCWAAVVQTVGQYMTNTIAERNRYTNQCAIVSAVKGTPCPDQSGFIGDISNQLSAQYGTLSVWQWPFPAQITESTLQDQIKRGRPVILRWEWGGMTGAHFVVARGVAMDTSPALYKVIVPRQPGTPYANDISADLSYSRLVQGSVPGITSFTWNGTVYNINRPLGT